MEVREATLDDLAELDAVLNHPSVIGNISDGKSPLTIEGKIGAQLVYYTPGGVMLGDYLYGNAFLFMCAFMPGTNAALAVRMAIRKAFTETECREAYTTSYLENRTSHRFLKTIFFGEPVRLGMRRASHLTYLQWSLADRACMNLGFEFVSKYNPQHTVMQDDACALGAFLMTASKGQVGKALEQFDTYRIIGGRPLIKVLDVEGQRLGYGEAEFTIDDIVEFVRGGQPW